MEFEPRLEFALGERGKREGQKDEQPKKRFFHNILLFRIVLIETSGIVKESFMFQSTSKQGRRERRRDHGRFASPALF
jgi:hypothetical protein